jgi:ethanolamine ammonia-lyase small subunit
VGEKNLKPNVSLDLLKTWTRARIGLKAAGSSLPSQAQLQLNEAHARARDAIYFPIDFETIKQTLKASCEAVIDSKLISRVASREQYLTRPDLGRLLSEDSVRQLQNLKTNPGRVDLCLVDGLSPFGVQKYGAELALRIWKALPEAQKGQIAIVQQGRVAIGDQIGEILGSRLVIVLIGERPGLSSFESVGAYLTYEPHRGRQDAERNCVSNICETGLHPDLAADKILHLVMGALQLQLTGTRLKEDSLPILDAKK